MGIPGTGGWLDGSAQQGHSWKHARAQRKWLLLLLYYTIALEQLTADYDICGNLPQGASSFQHWHSN